ncbi:MAG TPA: asparaginase, partial [Myxococcota bacterium]|nr:asparaginase [Myxococcota bacterium]
MSSAPCPDPELDAPAPEPETRGGASGASPVLVRLWRGARVESQHRGAWVLADPSGAVLDGAGDWERPVFARSSVKSLQA